MNFIRQIERLQMLNKLIREERTGTPEELADRLGVSRRQLYTYFDLLKDFGLEVGFSRKINSFYYYEKKDLKISLKIQVLESAEMANINGGASWRKVCNRVFGR
ncbi:MAG: HTH domain-containing protein [Cyclobacteriaceae bacterium]|nr:HTH domain-containing protein [Cyclobacteriaceae bacterium]